jgi:hypothetical protein
MPKQVGELCHAEALFHRQASEQKLWMFWRHDELHANEVEARAANRGGLRPIEPFSAHRDLQAYSGGLRAARPQLLAALLAAPLF